MFKKILFLVILFSSSLKAEIVKEVQVIGNDRISAQTIKLYSGIEIGKDYIEKDINEALKDLFNSNFFEDVGISLERNILKISVKEYPIINSLLFKGEKSSLVKKAIEERLQLKNKGSFIKNKLNEDILLIKNIYASLGYNFAKVDAQIEKFSENRLNLIYSVEKGNKTFIKTINFIGNKKIRDSRLREVIASEEMKFWKFLSKNTYYNNVNIDLDKRLLLNYYKSLGFYDVQIISNNSFINEDNFVVINYSIDAGQRYKVSKITTNVDKVLDKKFFDSLEKNYLDIIGKYYSPFKVKKLLDELDRLILNNDLQFVEHSVNEIIEGENIEIKINVFESEKKLVEKLNILGNSVTDESVIRSELLIDEGDPLNDLKISQSIARLKSRKIFGDVKVNVSNGSNKDLKVIEVLVEEKPTGEISAGAGLGTSGGSLAFNISENNWLGKGINLSTNLEVDSQTFTGGLYIRDPNYKYSGNEVNYYISNTVNDKPNSGFKNNVLSSGFGTRFEQYKDIYLSPGLSFSYDKLKVENTASTALKSQKGSFFDMSFDYGITTDKRDRAYGPTEGYVTSFSQQIPIYADSPYIKNSFSLSKYHSFSNDIIGAFKFYGAAINGLNSKDVRLSKRLGLPNSRLRGFEVGKIGPKDGNDYVGGNYTSAVNFEVNLPNLLPESTRTDVGLFLDFGNIWHVDYSNNIDDSNKIRSSLGVNSSWNSPIGPMSFIFSQNLSKASTDITESFNFRLGTTF